MPLTPEQARVLASLIEKQLTTPQQYPMTLNALVAACNQTTNRNPVVDYDERLVERSLTELKADGLVRFVLPSHGRSVTRYRQVFDESYGLDVHELALVAVLLLRGPQTAGELRARTDRMWPFDDVSTVEAELQRLSETPQPLTERIPRRPGLKEDRWIERLTDVAEPADASGPAERSDPSDPSDPSTVRGEVEAANLARIPDEVTLLRDEVAGLRDEVAGLRAELDVLRSQLGG